MASKLSQTTIRILPYSRTTCRIEELRDDNVEAAYNVISDAAKRADNVGFDEIPTIEYLKYILNFFSGWTFNDLSTGEIHGLLLIGSCRFVRSEHPTLAQAVIVTSQVLSRKLIHRELAEIACEFTLSMGAGYSACLMEVFSTCTDHMMAYREAGFVITCVIPTAGKLSGKSGHISSYIMYKDLCSAEVPISLNDKGDNDDEDLESFKPTLRECPTPLPVNYRTHNGLDVIIRAMRQDEVQHFYAALKEAAASGAGYGFDELPSLGYFSRWYVHEYYNFVIEERCTGKYLAFQNYGPSLFSRSQGESLLSDGNNVILPEFRGMKLSEEFTRIHNALSIDCGFSCMFGETAVLNLPSISGMSRIGVIHTGTIPKGIFFRNIGWVDLVTIYMPFPKDHKSLQQIVHASKI